MMNFMSADLALGYFVFALVAILGTFQIVAARQRWIGLSLLAGCQGMSPWGYVLGSVLVGGAYLWFLITRQDVFRPGLAGAELFLLFALAFIGALAITLFLPAALYRPPPIQEDEWGENVRRQEVSFGPSQGVLYIPQDQTAPRAAICALPSPEGGRKSLHRIVRRLIQDGFVVLTIDVGEDGDPRYPDVLALLPAAISYLAARDEADPQRIGVIGADLGGDLSIRAASSDEQIKALVALALLLEEENSRPGLNVLREMTYAQAIRWSRFRGRGQLLTELETLSHAGKLAPRPLLFIYGQDDGLVAVDRVQAILAEKAPAAELKLVPGERHLTLLDSPVVADLTSRWFKENL